MRKDESEYLDVDLEDAESLKLFYIRVKEKQPLLSPDEIFEILSLYFDQELEDDNQLTIEERLHFINEMKEKVLI
jgi:hypothetical protein